MPNGIARGGCGADGARGGGCEEDDETKDHAAEGICVYVQMNAMRPLYCMPPESVFVVERVMAGLNKTHLINKKE